MYNTRKSLPINLHLHFSPKNTKKERQIMSSPPDMTTIMNPWVINLHYSRLVFLCRFLDFFSLPPSLSLSLSLSVCLSVPLSLSIYLSLSQEEEELNELEKHQ